MNPSDLFNPNVAPQQKQLMEMMNILLGGLGRGPAAQPLSPSLGLPAKRPEPLVQRPLLGGTPNG